jgi:tRNA threonylcarbamoyladenosine biosynthesis protein TsaB
MIALGLDCVHAGCAIALLRNGEILDYRHEPMQRGQDSRLLPMIETMVTAAGIEFSAIDQIVALRGPGSFTGIRIGLAAARGLGLALDRPVLGIDRLELYAAAIKARPLLVYLQSGRTEFFCLRQATPNAALEIFLADVAALAIHDHQEQNVTGDSLGLIPWQTAQKLALPEPEIIMALRLAATLTPNKAPALPLYLRAPDVSHGPKPALEEAAPFSLAQSAML